VNIDTTSFNTITGQMTETSQRRKTSFFSKNSMQNWISVCFRQISKGCLISRRQICPITSTRQIC